jgi:glycosyltransferase involved in cell wall biosynthesis
MHLRLLVLATDYPTPDGRTAQGFIHSRNKEYLRAGIKVDVLSFSAGFDYMHEGIHVYTLRNVERRLIHDRYDLLVSHAPNLRNHLRFLGKYGNRFPTTVFFFHGHEVLRTTDVYPPPYPYMKRSSWLHTWTRNAYDELKIRILRRHFCSVKYRSHFVFVSNWMAKKFHETIGITPKEIEGRRHIIYNCVGRIFQERSYDRSAPKTYDFITIRNQLDGSKYAIDIVCRIAERHPELKFCVVGKGKFFRYFQKPTNLIWVDKHLSHEEIVRYLDESRCALLPTRADAQGVMACEMATFGIPLITSDLEVCSEVFDGFRNVALISNEEEHINIVPLYNKLTSLQLDANEKNERFMVQNTVGREIALFNELV